MTAKEILRQRMKKSYAELNEIALKKIGDQNANTIYGLIAYNLDISGKTVGNYVEGLSDNGNGYLIEAIIAEFKKLPSPKPKKLKTTGYTN